MIVFHSLGLAAATFGALALAHFWLELDERSVVTVAFLTLAFAQLWHVFNMRAEGSGLLRSEVMRNPWIWGSLLLCTALLSVPPYLASLADILHLAQPDLPMWIIIVGMSLAPLLVGQWVAHVLRSTSPKDSFGRGRHRRRSDCDEVDGHSLHKVDRPEGMKMAFRTEGAYDLCGYIGISSRIARHLEGRPRCCPVVPRRGSGQPCPTNQQ